MIKRKYIYHKRDKKVMKDFAGKKFNCVWRRPWETSKQTKTFLGNVFVNAYEKYICHHFKFFFSHKIYSNVFSNFYRFQTECNKGLFLGVNLKNRFFEGQNRQPLFDSPMLCISQQGLV